MPILLFLLLPFLELWLLINIGAELGALTTIALLILAGVVGMQLIRYQGFSTLLKINEKLAGGKDPSVEAIGGVMLALSGALFLFPGFISDAIALVFLIPFTRNIIAQRLLSRSVQQAGSAEYSHTEFGSQYQNTRPNNEDSNIYEGEFTEEPKDKLR